MAEETQAVSSPAEEIDVFQGQNVSMAEFQKYRTEGELPERFQPAEPAAPAPADPPAGDEPETEPDSEPDEAQEPPKGSGAEKRIKQLLARTKELERKLAEKPDVAPESSPAKAEAQQYTRPKPTAEDKKEDGTPKYTTYEDFVEDLADWKGEQRDVKNRREQEQLDAKKALQAQLDEARTRYDDADDVIFPANEAIQSAKIPLVVKEVFAKSALFVDLCYVVGSDPDELKKFFALAQSNPREAIGKVFEYERGIREELARPRDDKGQFVAGAPEQKKTNAPKPPSPVSGASSRAFDVSDDSLSPDEWMRKRNKQLGKA